jgi:hypothetical protein
MKRPTGLRTRNAVEALIARAAESCSAAERPECTCYCHGALHGQPHSAEWLDRLASAVYEQQFRYIKPEYRQFYERRDGDES